MTKSFNKEAFMEQLSVMLVQTNEGREIIDAIFQHHKDHDPEVCSLAALTYILDAAMGNLLNVFSFIMILMEDNGGPGPIIKVKEMANVEAKKSDG